MRVLTSREFDRWARYKEMLEIAEERLNIEYQDFCLEVADYLNPVLIRPDGSRAQRGDVEYHKAKVELAQHRLANIFDKFTSVDQGYNLPDILIDGR